VPSLTKQWTHPTPHRDQCHEDDVVDSDLVGPCLSDLDLALLTWHDAKKTKKTEKIA